MIHTETISEQRLDASIAHRAEDVFLSSARLYSIHDDYAGVTPETTTTALASAPRMRAATRPTSQNTYKLTQASRTQVASQASEKIKDEGISIRAPDYIPSASAQFWQYRIDESVKAYIRASDDFVAKLLVLRDKATGQPQYMDSIDQMIQKAAQRRIRIAIEGERAHAKIVRHVQNAGAELGHRHMVAVIGFAACMNNMGERLDKGDDI
jgi:hypothetical protein